MPLRDIEGFDIVRDFDEQGDIHGVAVQGSESVAFATGRNTSNDSNFSLNLRGVTTSPNKLIFGPYNATSYEYWTIGIALSVLYVNQNTEYPIIEFQNASGQNLLTINLFTLNSTSSVRFRVSVGSTDYDTAVSYLFGSKQFKYFEAQIRFNASGQFTLRLDEQSILTQSSINTINTSGTGNKLALIGQALQPNTTPLLEPTIRLDDLYIKTGTSLETFQGDVAVLGTFPTDNSSVINWTPLNGTNFQNVDDLGSSDGDQSFVSSSTALDEDRYLVNPIPGQFGNPIAVQFHSRKRLVTSGSRSFVFRYRNTAGGSAASAPTTHVLNSLAYQEFRELLLTNPSTASSWTLAEINSGSFGYRLET